MNTIAVPATETTGRAATGTDRADWVKPHPQLAMVGIALGASVFVGIAAAVGSFAGVAALAVIVTGLIVLYRPILGAFVLVAVVPAASGLRRGFPAPGLRLSEVLIASLSVVILLLAGKRRAVPWRTFDWLALAYVFATAGIGTFDVLHRGAQFTATDVRTMAGPLQYLLLYRAALTALSSEESCRLALRLIFLASVPVSLLAIAQRLGVPGIKSVITNITGKDWSGDWSYRHLPRATGPFPHWQMLGGYLFVVMLLGVGLLLEGSGRVLRKRTLVVVLGLAAVALIQTVTITPMIGVVVGALLLGFWLQQLRRLLTGLAVAGLVLGLAFGPTLHKRYVLQSGGATAALHTGNPYVPQTLAYRYSVWRDQYLPGLSGRWVSGYGPDLPPDVTWTATESMYITLLLRGGLLLLAVYGGLMWALGAAARRATYEEEDPDRRAAARVLLALVIILVPMHFVMPYFVDTGLPQLLWVLAGVALAGSYARGRATAETRAARPEPLAPALSS